MSIIKRRQQIKPKVNQTEHSVGHYIIDDEKRLRQASLRLEQYPASVTLPASIVPRTRQMDRIKTAYDALMTRNATQQGHGYATISQAFKFSNK